MRQGRDETREEKRRERGEEGRDETREERREGEGGEEGRKQTMHNDIMVLYPLTRVHLRCLHAAC